MLTFDEARKLLLAHALPVGPERISLVSAAGRVLAESVLAPLALPPFDASAMDGYALALASLVGEAPWKLPVLAESRAGRPAAALGPGGACRILTGAEVPVGADTVVMQEDVERVGNEIRLTRTPAARAHVRPAGSDLANGAVALETGLRLGPGQLALAAMVGRAHLLVARRPTVTILCSGDELRLPGEPLGAAGIYESNGVALAAQAAQAQTS